jgi:hypothetical protein
VITETDRAICQAWQCIADAECEHDVEHARRALARLAELVPQQRESADAVVEQQAERQADRSEVPHA